MLIIRTHCLTNAVFYPIYICLRSGVIRKICIFKMCRFERLCDCSERNFGWFGTFWAVCGNSELSPIFGLFRFFADRIQCVLRSIIDVWLRKIVVYICPVLTITIKMYPWFSLHPQTMYLRIYVNFYVVQEQRYYFESLHNNKDPSWHIYLEYLSMYVYLNDRSP